MPNTKINDHISPSNVVKFPNSCQRQSNMAENWNNSSTPQVTMHIHAMVRDDNQCTAADVSELTMPIWQVCREIQDMVLTMGDSVHALRVSQSLLETVRDYLKRHRGH